MDLLMCVNHVHAVMKLSPWKCRGCKNVTLSSRFRVLITSKHTKQNGEFPRKQNILKIFIGILIGAHLFLVSLCQNCFHRFLLSVDCLSVLQQSPFRIELAFFMSIPTLLEPAHLLSVSVFLTHQNFNILQKTKTRTTLWPSNSTPGCISKNKTKNTSSKRYMHSSVRSSFIYSCQDMEAIWESTNWWMDKEDVP